MLFHVIPEAQCVLRSKGVFRQVPVYRRNMQLFAKYGGGFIALRTQGGTSHPSVLWDHIEGVEYALVRLGPLQIVPPEDNVRLITAS